MSRAKRRRGRAEPEEDEDEADDEMSSEGPIEPLSESSDLPLPTFLIQSERDGSDYHRISEHVLHIAHRIPVLASLRWPAQVKADFLASGGREMPKVTYPDRRAEFMEAERLAREGAACYPGDHPVDRWARATFESYATAARMLACVGTPEFGRASIEIYGEAGSRFLDGESTNLDLARHLLDAAESLGLPDPDAEETFDARQAARILKARLRQELPGERVRTVLSRSLAAKAIAGVRRIRLRSDATFTRQEMEVLVVHEGLIHMATTINGLSQPILRCLGRGSPRTMIVQEGLAVFAEFMAGVVDLGRLRRLADRILAIDMAQRGADFLEIYRFYLERGEPPEEAYEDARRVFRGAALTGGNPFTKDVVYLHGAARVRGFFEVALAQRNFADLDRLFVGKIALADLDALRWLADQGWISRPKHRPAWARNSGILAASLSFGSFFRRIDMAPLVARYQDLYESDPTLESGAP